MSKRMKTPDLPGEAFISFEDMYPDAPKSWNWRTMVCSTIGHSWDTYCPILYTSKDGVQSGRAMPEYLCSLQEDSLHHIENGLKFRMCNRCKHVEVVLDE